MTPWLSALISLLVTRSAKRKKPLATSRKPSILIPTMRLRGRNLGYANASLGSDMGVMDRAKVLGPAQNAVAIY
jgi:hypothetical protein